MKILDISIEENTNRGFVEFEFEDKIYVLEIYVTSSPTGRNRYNEAGRRIAEFLATKITAEYEALQKLKK